MELKRFAGLNNGSSRLFRLVGIPYTSAGLFACCTAALTMAHASTVSLAIASPGLSRTMGHSAALVLAATSSLGAGSGMLALPDMQRGMAAGGATSAHVVSWSIGWGVVAAPVILAFLFLVGPGKR